MPVNKMKMRLATGNPTDARFVTGARQRLGMSQEQMAKELGMTQVSLSHIENMTNALSARTKRNIQELVARENARTLLAAGQTDGCAQNNQSPEIFFQHLSACAKCMAAAAKKVARL